MKLRNIVRSDWNPTNLFLSRKPQQPLSNRKTWTRLAPAMSARMIFAPPPTSRRHREFEGGQSAQKRTRKKMPQPMSKRLVPILFCMQFFFFFLILVFVVFLKVWRICVNYSLKRFIHLIKKKSVSLNAWSFAIVIFFLILWSLKKLNKYIFYELLRKSMTFFTTSCGFVLKFMCIGKKVVQCTNQNISLNNLLLKLF